MSTLELPQFGQDFLVFYKMRDVIPYSIIEFLCDAIFVKIYA
jgi:hypothetical protein